MRKLEEEHKQKRRKQKKREEKEKKRTRITGIEKNDRAGRNLTVFRFPLQYIRSRELIVGIFLNFISNGNENATSNLEARSI